jgi:hypothetical protein
MKKVGVAIAVSVLLGLQACSSNADGTDDTMPGADVAVAGNPNGKTAGGECAVGMDCQSGKCVDAKCTAPATDVGHGCAGPADCASKVCVATVCQAATATDGVQNGDETDIDCGGPGADVPRCVDDKGCKAATDCVSAVCDAASNKCAKPTSSDGVKNADESDIDCGGTITAAPKCLDGKSCSKHEDCTSDGCDDSKHCANGRSCTQLDGGRTCGAGEVGQAGAMHESCCGALTIPGRATKLDKYKITAGRMRAFVERTSGDVLGWYEANKASLSATQQAQIEPYKGYLPSDLLSYPYGANYQLGGTVYLPQRPSNVQGCFVGNAGNQANGSHTYWNGALEQEDRGFDQAFLDRLPLNCVTYPMVAAFCAWDGGRVETYDEHAAAYGASTYPWGNSPNAGGYRSVGGAWTLVGPATGSTNPCPSCDDAHANWLNNYQFPEGGNAGKPWDYAYWMSAPGRFPAGANAAGHQDLAGLQMELTATTTSTDSTVDLNGQTVNQVKVRWSKNGSWEGHSIGFGGFEFAVMTKYGKTGGRCARD